MQKITPFFWFKRDALKAAKFYISVFKKNSKVTYQDDMIVEFTLRGQEYMALNGGDYYKLNSAFSLYVSCKDQKEVDYFWSKLSKGGKIQQCGWLTDKFGLTWQIIPTSLSKYLSKDSSGQVFKAMLKMKKLNVAGLKKAYESANRKRK